MDGMDFQKGKWIFKKSWHWEHITRPALFQLVGQTGWSDQGWGGFIITL
jgi:hypothetical protein